MVGATLEQRSLVTVVGVQVTLEFLSYMCMDSETFESRVQLMLAIQKSVPDIHEAIAID